VCKRLECSECEAKFANRNDRKNHVSEVHQMEDPEEFDISLNIMEVQLDENNEVIRLADVPDPSV
jgi:hypothetical protein